MPRRGKRSVIKRGLELDASKEKNWDRNELKAIEAKPGIVGI